MAAPTISHQWLWLLLAALGAAATARADPLSALQILREGGCGGTLPVAPPLHRSALLDRAAQEWSTGHLPAAAIERSGYVAQSSATAHISGPDSSDIQLLRRSGCRTLADRNLSDIGLYHRGSDSWLVLAAAYNVPARALGPVLAARYKAGSAALGTAKTSWTRDSARWGWRSRRVRPPGADCTGCNCWPLRGPDC